MIPHPVAVPSDVDDVAGPSACPEARPGVRTFAVAASRGVDENGRSEEKMK